MADSVRLQILKAMKLKLQGVSNVAEVSYGFIPMSTVTQFPTICMVPMQTPYRPLTNTEYTTGADRNTADGWPVAVIGYVKCSTGPENFTDAMEDLLKDIFTVLLADHTLGLSSYVNNCYLMSTDTEIDVQRNVGAVVATFAIKYDFTKGSP